MSPFLFKRWKALTKSDYLSNSAKLLLISSVLLLLANTLSVVGAYNPAFSEIAGKISTFSFYIVFFLSFFAFNGEGIAYKHARETEKKKKTTQFKSLVLFAFLVRYVKSFIENYVLSLESSSALGVTGRLFMSILNTVSSYGFLLTMVALWYVVRDGNYKKLLPFEALAFISGLLYNSYKLFNYVVVKYELDIFGELFSSFFSQKTVLDTLCLLHFGLDIVMCITAVIFYDKKAIEEQVEKEKVKKNTITARKIYSTDCCGIDTLEDVVFMATEETD